MYVFDYVSVYWKVRNGGEPSLEIVDWIGKEMVTAGYAYWKHSEILTPEGVPGPLAHKDAMLNNTKHRTLIHLYALCEPEMVPDRITHRGSVFSDLD